MAINKNLVRCIHCLSIPDQITEDHVIPESWYSLEKSRAVRKPTAPACQRCNNDLGRLEKELSHLMWMCMPSSNPLTAELRIKALRAFGVGPNGKPLAGLDKREQGIRLAYLRRVMSETVSWTEINERKVMPGFGFHEGYGRNSQRGTLLNKEKLGQVAEKIVRGVEYIQKGSKRYIEEPYKLDVYFPRDTQSPEFEEIRRKCPVFYDGTNKIQRGAAPERPLEPIYIIRIWDQWEIWGVIMHSEREEILFQDLHLNP